jgi:monothiol glutaredoxin
MDEQLKIKIQDMIKSKKVFLFMKGTPDSPECGFSMKVASILKRLNIDFGSCNVLENPDIRQGIKIFSDWPTIPQLFINGKFIGGSDIVEQMYENGELETSLE